jgi:tripartite-type tricarboxylate transporter receptor subunit TctC
MGGMKILLAVLLAVVSGLGFAQPYPVKPVRLIIPVPPGGSNDVVGRSIGMQLGERLGQSVVIDNRGGAGSIIGTTRRRRRRPTGTRCSSFRPPFRQASHSPPAADAMKSFVPVAMLGSGPARLSCRHPQPRTP